MKSFDFVPVAAASIGQVHHAVLKDKSSVAMKIQYPGERNNAIRHDSVNLVFISMSVYLRSYQLCRKAMLNPVYNLSPRRSGPKHSK